MAEKKNKITRVAVSFCEEANSIREERQKKISDREITDLVVRHKNWPIMKRDIINYEDEDD